MTVDRIVNYHLNRLKDKKIETRLSAIEELRKIGRQESLEALQDVFKNDPDADVRKAAQEAGRDIFLNTRDNSQA